MGPVDGKIGGCSRSKRLKSMRLKPYPQEDIVEKAKKVFPLE